jgi:hypothetical protein
MARATSLLPRGGIWRSQKADWFLEFEDYHAIGTTLPFILPYELASVSVRKHPGLLFFPASLIITDIAAIALLTVVRSRIGPAPAEAACAVLAMLLLYLWVAAVARRRIVFTITESRILIVRRIWRRTRVLSIPYADIVSLNMAFTIPARLFGYATLYFEMPDAGRKTRKVPYLPNPESLYQEIVMEMNL